MSRVSRTRPRDESCYVLSQSDALLDLARVLAAAGRRPEAQAAVEEAVEILERKEAWALAARAREALRESPA